MKSDAQKSIDKTIHDLFCRFEWYEGGDINYYEHENPDDVWWTIEFYNNPGIVYFHFYKNGGTSVQYNPVDGSEPIERFYGSHHTGIDACDMLMCVLLSVQKNLDRAI